MAANRFLRKTEVLPPPLDAALVTGTNTFTIDIGGSNFLDLRWKFTRVAGTGNLTWTFDEYDDALAAWIPIQAISVSAGVGTVTVASVVQATASGSINGEVRLEKLSCKKIRCNLAAVTSATTDTISVSVVHSFQG